MALKEYKQNTYETCLTSCLISLCDLPANEENEIEIWRHGWKFDEYVVGQVNYIAEKFGKKFRVTIENSQYAEYLKKFASKGVEVASEKVNLALIKKKLPAIIYLDDFALHGLNHVPHFVLVTKHNPDKTFTIMEPYEGKFMDVEPKILAKGMNLLWNHIRNTRILVEEEK